MSDFLCNLDAYKCVSSSLVVSLAREHSSIFSCFCCVQLGEENERSKESAECIRHLVEQAVKLQKAMNQLKRGEKLNTLPAFQVFCF